MFSYHSDNDIWDERRHKQEKNKDPNTEAGEEDQGHIHHVSDQVSEEMEGVTHEVNDEEDDQWEDDRENQMPADGPGMNQKLDADHQ